MSVDILDNILKFFIPLYTKITSVIICDCGAQYISFHQKLTAIQKFQQTTIDKQI